MLCDGTPRPRLARPPGSAPHPAAAEQIPTPTVLRHGHWQRRGAAVPARPGRRRSRRARQRLAFRAVEAFTRGLGAEPAVAYAGGEGQDSVEESGSAAEAL